MIDFHQIYDLSDQPTTCLKCGTKTEVLIELKLNILVLTELSLINNWKFNYE